MSIYGENPRFKLGSYINQSIRTTFDKSVSKVSYSVFDQNAGQYIRKVGNRYKVEHLIFDLTLAQKNALLAMNGTKQTYTPFYDKTNNRQVYVDAYFDPFTYFPSSYVKLVLTDVDVDSYPTLTNSGLLDYEYINGYILLDGTDDFVTTPISTLPADKFTFCATVSDYTPDDTGIRDALLSCFHSTSDFETLWMDYNAPYYRIYYHKYDANGQFTAYGRFQLSPGSDPVRKIVIQVDKTQAEGSRVKIYLNGTDITYSDSMDNTNYANTNSNPYNIGKQTKVANFLSAKLSNIILTSDATAGHIANYQAGNYTSLTNQVLWYKCNEASGDLADSSGNSNTGVVNNADATFYNPPVFSWIYQWLPQDSLSPTNPYGRLTYLTNDLTLDENAHFEYEIENEIDSEEVSITGRLHRRYITDGDDEIVQKRKFTYKCYLLDETGYTNLNVFDGQEISFFPDADDTANYFTANCDIIFLNVNSFIHADYAEIEIIPRGQLQTSS